MSHGCDDLIRLLLDLGLDRFLHFGDLLVQFVLMGFAKTLDLFLLLLKLRL